MLDLDFYEKFKGFQKLGSDRSILLDKQNRMRSANLFLEGPVALPSTYMPVYSLRDRDSNELPSAYLIYMTSIDEYDAATKLVGSLKHWRKLLAAKWFMKGNPLKGFEGLIQWRLDMIDRDASAGKRSLLAQAEKGDTSAARKLVDMAKPAAVIRPGRPGTKADAAVKEADRVKADRKAKLKKLKAEHEAIRVS